MPITEVDFQTRGYTPSQSSRTRLRNEGTRSVRASTTAEWCGWCTKMAGFFSQTLIALCPMASKRHLPHRMLPRMSIRGNSAGRNGPRTDTEAVGQALLAACTLKPVVLLHNVHSPTGTGDIQVHRPRRPVLASHELLLPRLGREVVLVRWEES